MNIFSIPGIIQNQEALDILYYSRNARVERIVSQGHISPEGFWYNQSEDEFVILVEGNAKLKFKFKDEDEEEIILNTGDSLLIPAYTKHRVTYTSTNPQCIWICVFSKN